MTEETNISNEMTLRSLQDITNENLLAVKHKHPFDDRIVFDEEPHDYYIDGSKDHVISATTFIHQFVEHFDKDQAIGMIFKNQKYSTDPTYKYYKKTSDEIKQMWSDSGKEASALGTELHLYIELFFNGINKKNDSIEASYFHEFLADHPDLEIYRTEMMVFSKELLLAGSIDAIFKNPDGSLSLCDWKRSKEMKFEAFRHKKMKEPFNHMDDCNYSHYSLQLNLYRMILETYYGFKIKDMFLVVMHPNNKSQNGHMYNKHMVPRLEEEGRNLLQYRKNQLEQLGFKIDTNFIEQKKKKQSKCII